jgi:hypothetical protein
LTLSFLPLVEIEPLLSSAFSSLRSDYSLASERELLLDGLAVCVFAQRGDLNGFMLLFRFRIGLGGFSTEFIKCQSLVSIALFVPGWPESCSSIGVSLEHMPIGVSDLIPQSVTGLPNSTRCRDFASSVNLHQRDAKWPWLSFDCSLTLNSVSRPALRL